MRYRLIRPFCHEDFRVPFFAISVLTVVGLHIMRDVRGDSYRHHHTVQTVGSMVLCDETFFLNSAAHDEFRLHPVGTDGGYPQVFPFAVKGIAVAVHIERKTAAEYAVLVPAHAFQQPGKLPVVAVKRHIEHILLWYETEGVGGVRFLLRN